MAGGAGQARRQRADNAIRPVSDSRSSRRSTGWFSVAARGPPVAALAPAAGTAPRAGGPDRGRTPRIVRQRMVGGVTASGRATTATATREPRGKKKKIFRGRRAATDGGGGGMGGVGAARRGQAPVVRPSLSQGGRFLRRQLRRGIDAAAGEREPRSGRAVVQHPCRLREKPADRLSIYIFFK